MSDLGYVTVSLPAGGGFEDVSVPATEVIEDSEGGLTIYRKGAGGGETRKVVARFQPGFWSHYTIEHEE
jgi:hypothetical protein